MTAKPQFSSAGCQYAPRMSLAMPAAGCYQRTMNALGLPDSGVSLMPKERRSAPPRASRPRSGGITSNEGRSEGDPPSNWVPESTLDPVAWNCSMRANSSAARRHGHAANSPAPLPSQGQDGLNGVPVIRSEGKMPSSRPSCEVVPSARGRPALALNRVCSMEVSEGCAE